MPITAQQLALADIKGGRCSLLTRSDSGGLIASAIAHEKRMWSEILEGTMVWDKPVKNWASRHIGRIVCGYTYQEDA